MPKLLNLSKNWAFVLSVNLYEKTNNSGKLAQFSKNLGLEVIFHQIAVDLCSIGGGRLKTWQH
jgi:hypothetical protein